VQLMQVCFHGVACTVCTVQLMTVWHEYAAVNAYKHTEMAQQVAEAQQQLFHGIYLLRINFIHVILSVSVLSSAVVTISLAVMVCSIWFSSYYIVMNFGRTLLYCINSRTNILT